MLALGVALGSPLGGLVTYSAHSLAFRVLAQALAGLSNIGLYFAAFRVLTPRGVRWCGGRHRSASAGLF